MKRARALGTIAALALLSGTPAVAQTPPPASAVASKAPEGATPVRVPEFARGLAGRLDIKSNVRLRATSNQAPGSPILVRVREGGTTGAQVVEFLGVAAGEYDLREYLEKEDGTPAPELAPMRVRIVSQLPPSAGSDVSGTVQGDVSLGSGYRRLLYGAIALWVLVPIAVYAHRRLTRKPPAAPAPVPPPRTLADELRAMLEEAARGPMSVEARGKLELLLMRFWRERLASAGGVPDDPARAVSQLRDHPRTGEVVRAVESWLHRRDADAPGADARAATLLDEFRRAELTPAGPATMASSSPASPAGAKGGAS